MFIKVTDASTGLAILLNTAAVSSFRGGDDPESNTVAYIAQPYREEIRYDEDVEATSIVLRESRAAIEALLYEAGEF